MYRFSALLLASCASAFLHPTTWNGLESTFGFNPLSKYNFASLPRTVADAVAGTFKLLDNQCQSSSQKFRGQRFQDGDDSHVLLIFDRNGYIAGIQARVEKTAYTPSSFNKNAAFADDGDYWTLTVYFVDPKTICTGRDEEAFDRDGTGTNMFIQNGTNPETQSLLIPKSESDIKTTQWGNGKCFPLMGKHYWFNIRPEMPEEEFFPYCLLYNGGRLDAFCFAIAADLGASSPRWEHPNSSAANQCCINAPNFFFNDKFKNMEQTTLHIYMTDSPRTSFC